MSSKHNHMVRSHRSERRKPRHPGGQNFSRSKYHRIRSARPGLLSALRKMLARRKAEKKKGGSTDD